MEDYHIEYTRSNIDEIIRLSSTLHDVDEKLESYRQHPLINPFDRELNERLKQLQEEIELRLSNFLKNPR